MELVGIEGDVVVLGKVTGQQTDEVDEDFLHTLGRLAVYDGTLLGILQVKQEDGIEHAQHLAFIDMVGMNIADLAIQVPGVELLMKCMEGVKDDPITYDLLKDYLKDEEEDLFWSQGAVELIEKIGTQNWLLLQL